MKVPCVIAFHHQGKSQQFGTRFARQHLVKYKSDLRRALAEDALSLCSRNDGQGEPLMSTNMELTERERAMSHFKQLFKMEEIPKLPAKLELLKAKEAIKILRNLIVYDHNHLKDDEDLEDEVKKREEIYIRYGDPSWEPSFWPNHLWKWSDIQNFSNVTVSELKDVGLDNLYPNLTDFYRDVIRMGFEYFSLDPNEHLDEMFTEEEEDSRKRSRFIKSAPKAKKPRTSPTQSVFDEEQFVSAQEDVEREYEYRLPVISENIVAEDPHSDSVDHLFLTIC